MSDVAIHQVFPRVPPQLPGGPPLPSAAPTPAPTPGPDAELRHERASWLTRLDGDEGWRASTRRAGVGLAMMLPFALAVGLRTRHDLTEALVTGISFPVALSLVSLVGVAASTLGVTLVSAPLRPEEGADIASRALFRTGVLLFGLAPVTALWVAGGRWVEGALASTLAVAVAGITGIGSVCAGLVRGTCDEEGRMRLGALGVAISFGGFALLLGARTWLGACAVLLGGPS